MMSGWAVRTTFVRSALLHFRPSWALALLARAAHVSRETIQRVSDMSLVTTDRARAGPLRMQQVIVVVPVDADIHKTQDVRQEHREQWQQFGRAIAMWTFSTRSIPGACSDEFLQYYNLAKRHGALRLEVPVPGLRAVQRRVQSQPVLGVLHHVAARAA